MCALMVVSLAREISLSSESVSASIEPCADRYGSSESSSSELNGSVNVSLSTSSGRQFVDNADDSSPGREVAVVRGAWWGRSNRSVASSSIVAVASVPSVPDIRPDEVLDSSKSKWNISSTLSRLW